MYSSFHGDYINGIDAGNDNFFDSSSIPLNKWYHLATVFTNSSSTGRIFVNGVQTEQKANMEGPGNLVRDECYIGFDADNAAIVAIDELKRYNQVLSGAEILADYNTNGPIA
jgi:hypothetical protein